MISWFSRAMRSYSALRMFMLSEVTGGRSSVLYAGSEFMIEYILPSKILFSRSMAEFRSASAVVGVARA